ncbi:unnamed protein product, partial [marine sediment metagenome]
VPKTVVPADNAATDDNSKTTINTHPTAFHLPFTALTSVAS